MKFIKSRKFWVLNLLLLSFIILQALDFPKPYNYPWLFGTGKLLIFISIPLYISRFNINLISKISVTIIYLFLIILSYPIPFWKFKASLYLSDIQESYSEVVSILEPKDRFSFIIYNKQGDSLHINPPIFKSKLTSEEISIIQTFMIDNYYIEIHKERNGIALIYRRFLDNRSGFILCQNEECKAKMDATDLNNETYTYFNQDWYRFSAR